MTTRRTVRLLKGDEIAEVHYDIGSRVSGVTVERVSSPGAPPATLSEWDGDTAAEAFAYGHGAIQMLIEAEGFTFQDFEEYDALADEIGR